MTRCMNTIEFGKILDKLCNHAQCEGARARIQALVPILNEDILAVALRETSDARQLIEQQGMPPLAIMEGLHDHVRLTTQGGLLTPEQLNAVATFANTCRRMMLYMKKAEITRVELSLNGRAMMPLEDLQLEIEGAIQGDEVSDSASPQLRDVRRKITTAAEQVKMKLNRLLQGHKEWFSDGYVAVRGGRHTLPVKAQYRAMVPGQLIDRSGTGGTLFIEPQAVRAAEDELQQLKLEEENEVRRVLYALSSLVAECEGAITSNMKLMERLDFAFAKGRLSLEMDARAVPFVKERSLRIVQGRHPLIDRETAVPLDYEMDEMRKGVVITGPNTGGKTVALKTIGLLSVMAQSGLHIPAAEGSHLCMFNQVLVDIGDGQSISENLSTFSAHMTQVLAILQRATKDTLVLLDELGSGTDPAEGMGLAVAVLEELCARGCLFVATTHYPEVKEFAQITPGIVNARMAFDPDTLAPLYRMIMGEAGESCALHIAKRLGFPDELLDRARIAAYEGIQKQAAEARHMTTMAAPKLSHYQKIQQAPERAMKFERGDSVRVYPEGAVGIVFQKSDDKGMIQVHMKNGKQTVPYKRLKLIAPASQMYPEDYDFSIVFDSWQNRKAHNSMNKRHDPNAVATLVKG
ncbi:DNA mismatch repair protein MutS, partial [Eubacteriales bacterium OttesenSCG-928-N13]|nr:DNA mismatch repair protein MutS [Eubacteriales bacterium OttesenSCG-928-N13]